jgi:hypothetical protein
MNIIAKQAISTKKIGATNSRGSRITAVTSSGIKLTIPYPYELSGVNCHAVAAEKLARQLEWISDADKFESIYAAGGTKNGYVFVNRF